MRGSWLEIKTRSNAGMINHGTVGISFQSKHFLMLAKRWGFYTLLQHFGVGVTIKLVKVTTW